MTKKEYEPGSPEDLKSKGLVPTWRQQLEQAAIEDRLGEFDAIEAPEATGEATQELSGDDNKENEDD